SGPVEDVGKGSETVSVAADSPGLHELLLSFTGTSSITRDNGAFDVALRDGFKSKDLNKFLFEQGVVASQILPKKKSLEKQFLEILAGS
ncbi:MAG TPA: ABC transporter ATP-binding protein, partial [Chryseosolibacter sp.]|nr:ABC transporter ATP-binding protein [Chryseosolibacter sp.]